MKPGAFTSAVAGWPRRAFWPLKVVQFGRGSLIALLAFQLASTLFESFGLSMLLPVFQLMESGQGAAALAVDSRFWQVLIDAYGTVGLEPTIPVLLATSFAAIVARQVFVYCRLIYVARVRHTLVRSLRESAFRAFLRARLSHVEREGLGRIVNDLTVEMQMAVECAMAVVTIAGYCVVCSIYMALLFALSVPMTLAAIGVIAIAALPVVWLMREGRVVGLELVQANSALMSFLSERLRAVRLIRLSGMGQAEMENMERRTLRQYDRYMRGVVLQSRTTVLMEPIIAGAAFVFLYLGVAAFDLDLGAIGLFLLIVLRIAPVVKEILTMRFAVANRVGSVEQVERRLEELRSAHEPEGGSREFDGLRREIAFEKVSFEYPEQTAPALHDVSLTIPAGRITALVGPSGSGKSTLIDLLPRLRVPRAGEIRFDGVPAQEFRLASLRAAISYAPQTPQIFDVTVAEHIGYGSPQADRDAIRAAAELAGAHEFIVRLPQSYDTQVGEGGARLSGGQRQRLDLARALMGSATLLILDEPTSQLDADSEFAFRNALQRIREETGLTVVVVAHRLSTVAIADQIVVLRDGQVERFGSHKQLIAEAGWYAEAFRKQHQGARDDASVAPATVGV